MSPADAGKPEPELADSLVTTRPGVVVTTNANIAGSTYPRIAGGGYYRNYG